VSEIVIRVGRVLLDGHTVHKRASFLYNVVGIVGVMKGLGFGYCGGGELFFIYVVH